MVDNFFKPQGGIVLEGYGPSPTEPGAIVYDGYAGRLVLRDGYGDLRPFAHTDDTNLVGDAKFESSRLVLNVTDPVSTADNAGLVIKFGESFGDDLFGQSLFAGDYNPVVLWDQDTDSWFIGRADGYGTLVGTDAYGSTIDSNLFGGDTITINGLQITTSSQDVTLSADSIDIVSNDLNIESFVDIGTGTYDLVGVSSDLGVAGNFEVEGDGYLQGAFQAILDGPEDGYFMQSDVAGNASWAPIAALSYSDSSRPSASAAGQGVIIFNTDDNTLNVSDGSNWRDMAGNIT